MKELSLSTTFLLLVLAAILNYCRNVIEKSHQVMPVINTCKTTESSISVPVSSRRKRKVKTKTKKLQAIKPYLIHKEFDAELAERKARDQYLFEEMCKAEEIKMHLQAIQVKKLAKQSKKTRVAKVVSDTDSGSSSPERVGLETIVLRVRACRKRKVNAVQVAVALDGNWNEVVRMPLQKVRAIKDTWQVEFPKEQWLTSFSYKFMIWNDRYSSWDNSPMKNVSTLRQRVRMIVDNEFDVCLSTISTESCAAACAKLLSSPGRVVRNFNSTISRKKSMLEHFDGERDKCNMEQIEIALMKLIQ